MKKMRKIFESNEKLKSDFFEGMILLFGSD